MNSASGSTILTRFKAEREAERAAAAAKLPAIQNFGNGVQYMTSSDPRIIEFLGGQQSSSGYPVNERTALRTSAVYACINRIAGAIASLPAHVYERTEDGGRKRVGNSPLWYLLNEQPHPRWTAASWYEFVVACNGLRGDAISEIKRNRAGIITGFTPHHPDTVQTEIVGDYLHYYIQLKDGSKPYGLHQDDVIHIPNLMFDGQRSPSTIRLGAQHGISIALAADDFSGKLYANGAMPKHLIEAPGKLKDDQIEQLRKAYADRYTGANQVGKPMVLTEGLTIKELSMSAADAELLESRKYQVIDIARAFGVPPHMIGATETTSSWGTGIEQMTIGFVKFTIQPYLNRIEQELNRKIFRTAKYFIEFSLEGLLRGDAKSESETLRQGIGGSQGPGWMTPNEVRKVKNLPPVEGGDTLYNPNKGTNNAQASAAAAA
jgi:HK97 family phage portal protein